MRCFFPFLLLSLSLYLLTPAVASGRGCPGFSKRGACCPFACGQCGGQGCYLKSLSLKTRCCADAILRKSNNFPSCSVSRPPCRISGGGASPSNPQPNPTSTLSGSWRFASTSSGSLVKRHEACAVMVNGLVVLVGGRGVNRAVSIYNPRTGVWTKHNGPGSGIEIHHFQCVVAARKVWIVSSWTGKFPFEKNNDKIYVFDVVGRKWSTRNGMQASRLRGGGASVVRGDWIYVVAGNRGGHGQHATSLTWMDAYNYKTNTWTKPGLFPNIPGGGRDHVGGAIVKGLLCVAGGRNGGVKDFFSAVNLSTWCYNFVTKKWLKKANFPLGRAGAMTGTTCDGRMMIAGGEGNRQAYNRVDVFDGSTWKRAPDMKRARHGSGLAVAQCSKCAHIFIPSGSGGQGGSPELLTTEEYVPNGSPSKCAKY